MSFLDIVFSSILVIFFITSYLRGATKELFSLAGVLAGFFAAGWFDSEIAAKMAPVLPDRDAGEMLAYVLCIVAGYFLGMFLGAVADLIGGTGNSEILRVMGGLIGLVKGWVLLMAVYWVISKHIPAFQDEIADSIFGRLLGRSLAFLIENDLL